MRHERRWQDEAAALAVRNDRIHMWKAAVMAAMIGGINVSLAYRCREEPVLCGIFLACLVIGTLFIFIIGWRGVWRGEAHLREGTYGQSDKFEQAKLLLARQQLTGRYEPE